MDDLAAEGSETWGYPAVVAAPPERPAPRAARLFGSARAFFGTRRHRLAGAFVFFLLATLIWLSPLVLHLRSEVLIGPSDATLSIRGYWASAQQHGDPFTFAHDYLDGAPEGVPGARAVEIAQPVQTAAVFALRPLVGFIGGFNLFLISGFVLTGFFAYALLERLGFHPLVSLFGGYVLAFNPWCFARAMAGHAAFLQLWIFVAMILCFLEMSGKRTIRWAALAGLCYGFTFQISSYFGLLGSLVFALYFLFEFARVRGWEEKLWTTTLACAGCGVTLVCLVPGIIAYLHDRAAVSQSISNGLIELQHGGAFWGAYILPAHFHPVFGPITRHFTSSLNFTSTQNFEEQALFFGYTTMLLAAAGIVLLLRRNRITTSTPARRRALTFAAVLLPFAYWSSLPRLVHPFGVPVPGLSFFMGHVTSYFRVYARFGIIVCVALIILAAPALELIIRRFRHGLVIGMALWLLVGFELLPGPIYAWAGTSQPPAYDRRPAHEPPGIVAHYPLPTDQPAATQLGAQEIYYQMFAKHPLFNLFGAGTLHTREDDIRILARYITDPNTPSILAAEHVRYVVVHDDVYREEHEPPPVISSDFRLIKRFPNVRIYVLASSVKPANLSQLLEQNAVEIALPEGLQAPSTTYDGFSSPNGQGARAFRDGAILGFDNRDPALKRLQLVVNVQSAGAPHTLELVAPTGQIVGQGTVGMGNTQITFGPFSLAAGKSVYGFHFPNAHAGSVMQLNSLIVQPVSDFSISLQDEH